MNHPAPDGWISRTLRWGSYVSALLLAVGVAWIPFDPDVPIQVGPPIPVLTLGPQLAEGNPYAIQGLGVLVLLATPLLRVVVAGIAFWRRQEKRYTLVALLVLLSVLTSVWFSGGR